MQETARVLEFVRPGGVVTAVLLVVATYFVVRVLNEFAARLGRRFVDRRFLIEQVSTFARFGIYLAVIAACVPLVFQLTEEMMLALGGTIAVTVGFALKDLAASLLAGITILVDKPFQVGDRVTFQGIYGEITAIGLRSVRLVTLDDNLVTIPNNKFLTEVVSSGNAGGHEMLVQMDYLVMPTVDLHAAKEVVLEALTTSQYATLSRSFVVRVAQVISEGQVFLRIRAKAYVIDVRYETAFATDVTERVIEGFQRRGIAPYAAEPPAAAGLKAA